MRRFGLLAALATAKPALAGPLVDEMRERIAQRRAALDSAMAGDETLTLPPGVRVERDLAYGSDAAQRLDVYRPADAAAAPVVLFVHGGGWRHGDKAMPRMIRNKVPHWTGKGLVFVSANHRLMPAVNVIEQARDVSRALAFVQARAASLGGNPERVILIGHSAGAHLVSMITADAKLATPHGVQPWLATVAIDSAALDMEAVMNRPHYRFYDPVFGDDPAFWREASPTHRLTGKPAAPMLLVCSSGRDDSISAAREFAAKALGHGGHVTVLPVAMTHMQLNDQLGVPGEYTDAVDAFLRSVGVE